MLREQNLSPFDRTTAPAPHPAYPGAQALAVTQAIALAAAGLLGHAQSQDAVRKEAQALLLRAERARMDADQANADKSRFLAEAGHDLRTPLTTILGYGEIIQPEM